MDDDFDSAPEVGTKADTLGFVARREPFETNVFDYLAYVGSTAMGICGTLASFFDTTSDLLGAHANHVRARRQISGVADALARELHGDGE